MCALVETVKRHNGKDYKAHVFGEIVEETLVI
jgi:hypothetical protein